MMQEEFRDVPNISLYSKTDVNIHKNRLIFSFVDFNIHIPYYNRDEEDIISDISALTDLWAFIGMLDDEYISNHINEILLIYAEVQSKNIYDSLKDRNC